MSFKIVRFPENPTVDVSEVLRNAAVFFVKGLVHKILVTTREDASRLVVK